MKRNVKCSFFNVLLVNGYTYTHTPLRAHIEPHTRVQFS